MELKKIRTATVIVASVATLSLGILVAGCGSKDTSATTPVNEEVGKKAAENAKAAAQQAHPQQMDPGAQAGAAARAAAMGHH